MKKFLTIVMLLLVMVFTGKAQAVLFSENFDSTPANELPTGWTMYDVDGDGFNWYCDTNQAYAYGGSGHLITSASYRGEALTPNNWLITPTISVNGNCKLTFQVAGQDYRYAEEHYSVWISTDPDASNLDAYTMLYDETLPENTTGAIQYLGRTVLILGYSGNVHIAFRHHDVTDMFRINFDNIAVSTLPNEPTIACEDTMINFKYRAIGAAFARKSFKLTAFNLTGNVNLTVAAPFTISTDSVSGFGSTLNLQPVNGVVNNQIIYVKASSAAAGDFSEYLTISSTGAEPHSIHLQARVFDCSQPITLPWDEYFDSGIFPPSCWTLESTATGATESGYEYTWGNHGTYAVCTGDDEQYQNEKLISPTIDLTGETGSLLLSFYYRTNPSLISDSIKMVVELQDNGGAWTSIWDMADNIDEYAAVWDDSWPAHRTTVDLTSYVGHQIKVRFRYIAELGKACQIWMTGVTLDNFTEPYLAANTDTVDCFAYIGEPMFQTVKVNAFNLINGATVTTEAPFQVSLDGISYHFSVTINNGYRTPLYLMYNPTTETMESGMVILTGSSIDSTVIDTIVLNGISHDCSDVTLPIVEGFESVTGTVYAPDATEYCWHVVYENEGETNNIMVNTPNAAFIGDQAFSFASNFYNAAGVYGQYLISPEITSSNPMLVTFNYAASSAAKPETFAVGYSTTTRDTYAFTWETPIVVSGTTDWNYYMNNNVPANTKYVAIKYLSAYKQHLYIDNFKIMANPSCLFPLGLTTINTTENTAIIGWDSVNTADAWQIAYGYYPVDIATAVPVDVNSTNYTYTLTGLTANSHYQVYFRTVCGIDEYSEWADPIEFYTTLTPAETPYTMGFETSEEDVENWVLQNANEPNKFIVGTGAHAQGSQRGLYISRDNSANTYVWVVGSGDNETNVSNYSTVWAYRDIHFNPTTEAGYLLKFDWRCYGEPDYDFGEVFIGNATAVTNFERNDSIPGYVDVNNSNYTPAGLTKLGRLCGNNTWTTASYILPASEYSGMTKRIYFLWTNDSLSGNNNPIGIDNISIVVPEFATIGGLITDGTTQAPIANANITFTSEAGMTYTAVSDNNGSYTINGAVTGEYAILVTANGYNPTISSYLVSAGVNYIPLTLNKEPCTIVPANVEYEIEDDNMLLYWDQIESGTMSQANLSTIESALGVQAATYEMSPYHLFTPDDLTTVNGASITSVGMYVVGDPTYCTYTIKFWVGGTGVAADGPASEQPVFEKVLTPDQISSDGWTEVNIEPYKIDGTKCLWIGYSAYWENHPDGNCYPCGFTDYRTGEPNNPGYGDVLYFNQAWQTSGYGDWCIRATAQAPDLTYTILKDGEVYASGITEAPYTISPYDPTACYKVFTTCENGEVSLPSECAGGVGVEEFSNESSFSVYPNPATDVVTVSSSMNADRAEVLNYLGQVIYSQKVSDNVFTMNVASLADGVYFIRLIGNDGIATQKLIKK